MRVRMLLSVTVVGTMLGLAAPAAHAFGVANNCTTPTSGSGTTLSPNQPCWVANVYNDDYTGMSDIHYTGPPAQVSGGHPFTGVNDFTMSSPSPAVSTVRVTVPPGLDSNPEATPKCSDAALTAGTCPGNTQLGIVKLHATQAALDIFAIEDVYSMPLESSSCPNSAGVEYVSDWAFYVSLIKQRVDICGSVDRQPPYNQFFTITIPPGAATISSTLVFWGVPGDSGHNPQRGQSCLTFGSPCSIPASGPSAPSGTAFITTQTACVPAGGAMTTLALGASDGSTATATSPTPVPVINCQSLPFSPKLKLALKGRTQTGVGKHPTLVANLTQPAGQANIALSKTTLPLSLALDPKNSQHVCAPLAAFNDTCPAKTVIGSARAVTSLVSRPLTGKVYLVQGIACTSHKPPSLLGVCPSGQPFHTDPALLVALRGQAMIDLHAQTSVSPSKKLVTTFFDLPDLPVSSFQLAISGGKRGLLVVTGNKSLCAVRKQIAPMAFRGKNGATESRKLKMTTPCKKK